MLAAPLVPYLTVGVFLGTILLVSGVATLMILPALLRLFETTLFRRWRSASPATAAGSAARVAG
jgi:hypothetical protein